MADNVTLPARGTGTLEPIVATEEVGGAQVQVVKIASGTVGSKTAISILTDAELRATPVPVSGSVAVTGGMLTDAELRATPVPISGTVTTSVSPLTDTQLRATAVPVSGTVAVTGGLTDAELRATAVPISGTVTTSVSPLTNTQLRATAVPVSGTVTALTTGLTDAELRADSVPTLTMFESASLTGTLGAKTAHIHSIIASRSRGWASSSVLGDVCEYLDTTQSLLNIPGAGQTLYLRSTSNNDRDGVGPGVTSVRITYLNGAGVEATLDVATNGNTVVNLGTGFSFIQNMEALTVLGAEVAAGDITISSTNGAATVATTFEMIAAGGTRSMSGRFRVPAGTRVILNPVWTNAAIGGTMDIRLRIDSSDLGVLTSGVYQFKARTFLAAGTSSAVGTYCIVVPAGSTIKVSAIPGGTPSLNKIDSMFGVLVVDL
jgi:hypothetical protein